MNVFPPAAVVAASLFLLCACGREDGRADDARHSLGEGWEQYSYGAYDGALSTFDHVAKRAAPASDQRAQALYGMATVWDLRRPGEDPARAARLYREVIALQPRGDAAAWSALALARTEALVPVDQLPDRAAVRAAYQRVIDAYPDRTAGEEAFILLQTDRARTFDPADSRVALAALAQFAEDRPNSLYLDAAHSLMAECHHSLGEPEGRLSEEIRAVEIREARARAAWEKRREGRFVFNDPSFFKVAHIAEFEVGDFDTARKYYGRYLQENPTDKRTFFARQALERMDKTESELRAAPAPANPPARS